VRAYFGPGGRHGRLIGRALEELESLDHETCGSEFAALLREDRLIKELRPPCNRRAVGGGGAYLKLTLAEDSPRLYAVRAQLPDGAAYFGPVRSQRIARGAVTALRRLYALDTGETPALAADEVRRLLSGEPSSLADLGRRLAVAVHEGRLEVEPGSPHCPAAALLGALGGLARARRAQDRLAVLLEPGEEEGSVEAFFVAAGVVCHQASLTAEWWREPARRGLAIVRRESRRPPRSPSIAALDELGIVESRLRERDGAGATLELAGGWTTGWALAAIGRAVGALAGIPGSPCEPLPPSP
jgi:hypothetical protein